MMHVARAGKPLEFDAQVGDRGERAMLELIGSAAAPRRRGRKRPVVAATIEEIPVEMLPDFWRFAIPMLRAKYAHTCAYLGMRIDPATGHATVDHFIAKCRERARAYDWANFRLASGQMNTNKGDFDDVLDPFEIEDGWFVLDLGTFKVKPADALDDGLKARIRATIIRLKLNDPVYCDARETFRDRYHGLVTDPADTAEPWPLAYVAHHGPYVAAELRRQNELRPGDT